MYFHTICKQTLVVFFLLKNIGVTVTLKKKKKSSGRHSSARVFSVYYTAKYIAQKCIVDVWVVVMIETKPTLMTHTVLPKIRFLMTFIQINNTVYIFARIK